jgi:hypothetical protein
MGSSWKVGVRRTRTPVSRAGSSPDGATFAAIEMVVVMPVRHEWIRAPGSDRDVMPVERGIAVPMFPRFV